MIKRKMNYEKFSKVNFVKSLEQNSSIGTSSVFVWLE